MARNRRKNKATIAPTVTSPAKMGEEMAYPAPNEPQSANLKYTPRGPSKGGSIPREKGAPGRTNYQTDDNRTYKSVERLGAQWAPQMPMHSPDRAVGADQNLRNTLPIQSAVGNRDFYLTRRRHGQTGNFG